MGQYVEQFSDLGRLGQQLWAVKESVAVLKTNVTHRVRWHGGSTCGLCGCDLIINHLGVIVIPMREDAIATGKTANIVCNQ